MICPSKNKSDAGVLLDYGSGALNPALAAQFEKHMECCPECRRAAAAQRELWKTLGCWTAPEVSPYFDARLYARTADHRAAPAEWVNTFLQRFWKPLAVGAAGAMIALGLTSSGFFAAYFAPATPHINAAVQLDAADRIDIQQVANTLDVLDMLTPLPPGS